MQQNGLMDAASTLFALVAQLREMSQSPDVPNFRSILLREMDAFVRKATTLGFDQEAVSIARYALCATIDEAVMITPWGGLAGWAGQGMVLTFYQDLHAGEKFFLGLNKLAANPVANMALLELFYTCIALGFRGRFAVIPNGNAELERIHKKVFAIIEAQRGLPGAGISQTWQGSPTPLRRANYWLPFWWSTIVCLVLALIVVSVLRFALSRHFERDLLALAKLEYSAPAAVTAVAPSITLRQLLKAEIERGYVELDERPGQSIIRIRGDELFASGSTRINEVFVPVIGRITQAVHTYGGMVTVAGHTDNRPLRTLSFQSNLELSRMRAQNVADIMLPGLAGATISVIGRGDMEPLSKNDTVQNRARNRRVEVRVDSLR